VIGGYNQMPILFSLHLSVRKCTYTCAELSPSLRCLGDNISQLLKQMGLRVVLRGVGSFVECPRQIYLLFSPNSYGFIYNEKDGKTIAKQTFFLSFVFVFETTQRPT
jgi:hypothetical protein